MLLTKDTIMSTLKSLNSVSEMLIKASGSLDKRIAQHLVNIAKHINGAGNGDVSAVNYFWGLLTAGGRSGLRHDAIGNWLLAYAGVSWNTEKKQYGRKKGFVFSEQLAVENPWYLFTKQAPFKPFDLDAAIKALIKKAHNALEDGSEEAKKHNVNKEHLKALEAMLSDKPAAYVVKEETEKSPIINTSVQPGGNEGVSLH